MRSHFMVIVVEVSSSPDEFSIFVVFVLLTVMGFDSQTLSEILNRLRKGRDHHVLFKVKRIFKSKGRFESIVEFFIQLVQKNLCICHRGLGKRIFSVVSSYQVLMSLIRQFFRTMSEIAFLI